MKILFWNARGLGNSPTRRVLRRMVSRYQPLLLGLSEPFVQLSSIKSSFWKSLRLSPVAVNDRGARKPNIWLLCHQSLQPHLLLATKQQLTISCIFDSVTCIITWVYAKTTATESRQLWDDLFRVKNSFVQGPWLVLGDFNCVLGAHEKRGGILPKAVSCSDFQAMSTSCDLFHLPTKGMPFTWTNKRGVGRLVEMRLDRCLINMSWIDVWCNSDCTTLTRTSSDYCPLLVCFSKLVVSRPCPFRFQRMWIDHPGFMNLVANVWKEFQFFGHPMYVLASKLRALKQELRNWNKSIFGDVNLVVEEAFADLDNNQQKISESAHLSVLINGSVEGFFQCSRGVRQGDPLSPLPFCLAEEVLSRGLSNLVEEQKIDLMATPLGIVPPSHVLFADDIMVFMRATKRSLRNLMKFMEEYGLNSGQRVNKAKSLVFLGNHAYLHCIVIKKILGVSQGSLPFTYLGVPIFMGRPKKMHFQAIADKIRCKLSTWKGALLSQAGRLQLILSVIQGILVYSFQIYHWPSGILQSWDFFWTGDPLKRGLPLVSWSTCCKKKGGRRSWLMIGA